MNTGYKLWTEGDLDKSPSRFKENGIPYVKSFASMKNKRDTMEDRAFVAILSPEVCFCGVLDGHGGIGAVNHFIKVIPKALGNALSNVSVPAQEQVREVVEKVFLEEDEKWCNKHAGNRSGTTFTGVLIFSGEKKVVYVINLGDSRTILCSVGITFSSLDHKPTNPSEIKRIEKAGGSVWFDRIDHMLAVSRALGDVDFKGNNGYKGREAKVSPIPDVTEHPFSKDTKIIMGSDGLFDAMPPNGGSDMIWRYINDCEDPCGELMEIAGFKSSDNIMIMMLDLS
jgi:serine/threonine protein phosphatase PrpC